MTSVACRVFGHAPVFEADGATMRWTCARGCADGAGSKSYETADQASRYAKAFNRRDTDFGGRAPMIGLLPLRLWRRLRDR